MKNRKSNFIVYTVIILAVAFYAFLTGCGGSSSTNPTMVYYNGDSSTQITPQTINVNIANNGKVYSTTSPSGKMTLEAPEENTYDSDVLLKITESPSVGNESNLLTVGSIIYGVTATKDGSPVNLLNHPLNLTLSNEEKLNGAESYYIGIKDINGGDWQFVNVYSPNPSARASTGSKNQFTYSIYKNNILVALFADIRNILQSTPKVLGVIATLTPSVIPAENSVYTEDLKVNLLLSGENLSGLSADSFKIKVSYITSDSRDSALKVDGTNVSHTSGSGANQNKASGNSYAHYFQFVPLNTKYSSGFAPAISFDINLKDTPVSAFPNNFIVEISNNNANCLSFAYSTFLGFDRTGSASNTDTDTNTATDTETETGTNTGTDTDIKAVISLKSPAADFPVEGSKVELEFSSDIAWNDADKAKITIDNNAIINDYSYSNKVLSLTFRDRLAYNTTYVLKITDMTGVENATLIFKTANIGTVALKSAATDFQVSNNKIELEFSNDIPWSLADKAKISIDNNAEISDYSYSNKVLTLTLRQRLKFNSTYLIKVTGLEGIENNTLVLKTEPNAVASLKSATNNLSVNAPIEVEFSKDIYFEKEDISNISLDNGAEIDESSYFNKVLRLKVKGKLKYETIYTLTFNGVNGVASGKTLSFNTEKISARPVITLAEDSIMPNMNGRTSLKPNFYIDFGKPIASTSLALNNIKLNGTDLPEGCILDFDADLQNAVLKFTNDLEEAIDYNLTLNSYTDEDNGVINSVDFSFRTMPPEIMPGSGTIDDPFLVYTQNHLKQISNSTPFSYYNGSYFFKQMDDINITEYWIPIGDEDYHEFNGNYDGNNKVISNLRINGGDNLYKVGLFGIINNGSISNLTLRNVDLIGKCDGIAPVAGYFINSVAENIKIEGNINISFAEISNWNTSGFVGKAENSKIRKVSVIGNLNIAKDDTNLGSYRGGIAGYTNNGCEISDCLVDSPNGIIRGSYYVGGLVGVCENSKISNSYAQTNLKVHASSVGGFAGGIDGSTIENCYSNCNLFSEANNNTNCNTCGGFSGSCREGYYGEKTIISSCYASGTLNLKSSESYKCASTIGTFIGYIENNNIEVNNSFSTVNIFVDNNYVFSDNAYHSNYNPEMLSTPIWYTYETNAYVYNSDGTNHCGSGYKTTLNWNTAYWFNLVEGGFPKLIGLPNR